MRHDGTWAAGSISIIAAVTQSDLVPRQQVAVIDLATGNIGSVVRMLERMGVRPRVWRGHGEMDRDSAVILPGVGHFSHAARSLGEGGWRMALQELHNEGRPILGICLGAQLLCDESEEGPGAGLGWIRAQVRRFPATDAGGEPVRVPHMGWLNFTPPVGCFPFRVESGRMYYAHSFYIEPTADPDFAPYQAEYGGVRFAAAVRSRNAIGLQFHPEKSHLHGLGLLRQWLRWTEEMR